MIIPDVNILVYAYDSTSPFHEASRKWWAMAINDGGSIGLPWSVVLGFLRLITHPKVFANPIPIRDALSIVDTWLQRSNVTILDPGSQHWRLFNELINQVQLGGKLVSDAHLGAIAKEFRAEFITNDRDFERFSGVLVKNPLAI